MKKLKLLLKILGICVLLVATFFAAVYIYMRVFGNGILERTLSRAVGAPIKFKSIAFNMDKGSFDFSGFQMSDTIDLNKTLFEAEKFIVTIDREKREKENKFIIKEILIERGVITIDRTPLGAFELASPSTAAARPAPAAGNEPKSQVIGSFLHMVKSVRKITIKDTSLTIRDYYIGQQYAGREPLLITLDRISINLGTNDTAKAASGAALVDLDMNARVPRQKYGNGTITLRASMAVYADRTDMEMTLDLKNIDAMFLEPYFRRYSPFLLYGGVFRSSTRFNIHNNNIDSLTTVVFGNLNMDVDRNRESAQFMAVSVDRLAPYLMSGNNEITFDFVIEGPAGLPVFGLGPKVKFAIGMVALEEFSKAMQQLQSAGLT